VYHLPPQKRQVHKRQIQKRHVQKRQVQKRQVHKRQVQKRHVQFLLKVPQKTNCQFLKCMQRPKTTWEIPELWSLVGTSMPRRRKRCVTPEDIRKVNSITKGASCLPSKEEFEASCKQNKGRAIRKWQALILRHMREGSGWLPVWAQTPQTQPREKGKFTLVTNRNTPAPKPTKLPSLMETAVAHRWFHEIQE
jgi:hypothetical protein